jgi:pimeloyl-ACP methyl ester carboxylesterase
LPSLKVSGLETFVYKRGMGKTTLVFVHGAAYNHTLWSRQWPALSSLGQLVAIDLPGHGASSRFPAGQRTSIQAYANHMYALLSMLDSESNVVIGHSMGGAISMRYSIDHPDKVIGLILIGTGAKLGVSKAILGGLSKDFQLTVRDEIGGWAFAKRADKHMVEEAVREMLKCSQDVAIADFEACKEFDIRNSLSSIKAPTLIIVGDEDRLTPPKWSEFLHNKIVESQMKIIKATGHMVMIENPDEVNSALNSFISQLVSENKKGTAVRR